MNLTSYPGSNGFTNTPSPIFHVETTKELILKYCSVIDQKLIFVIGIAALMWILQPVVFKAFDKFEYSNQFVKEVLGPGNLKIVYKWIGVGLLFMAGYMIYVMV